MSLTAALASAVSGLNVAQRALSVTANNVANANTEGYSRKVLNQQAWSSAAAAPASRRPRSRGSPTSS